MIAKRNTERNKRRAHIRMNLIFGAILMLFSCQTVFTHIAIIPYPYTNREYPLVKDSITDSFWHISGAAVFFDRFAYQGFNAQGITKNVSTVFHGDDCFDLSDLSPHQKILLIEGSKNDSYRSVLNPHEYIRYEGKVIPSYKVSDKGVVLGCDIEKKRSDLTYKLQLRLPIIQKNIQHDRGWNAIEYQDAIEDERLYLEPHNKHFQVRADYLTEKGIISHETRGQSATTGIFFAQEISENYFLEKTSDQRSTDWPITRTLDNDDIDETTLFAVTKFTPAAEPTTESLDFFDQLFDTVETNRGDIFRKTTAGHFLGKNIAWTDINRILLAPLDIQLNAQFSCFQGAGLLSGLLSFVVPLSRPKITDNYLENSFSTDHFALRLGSQCSYELCRQYTLVGYGSWQYNIPHEETIQAVFENQAAFGLNPLYIKAKTSWSEWFLAADLVFSYNKDVGGYLGYEFFKKTPDTVSHAMHEFHTVSGEIYPLNYTQWRQFTESAAHLLVFSCYGSLGPFELSLEYKAVITGKNSMNMREGNLKILCTF